MTDLKQRAAEIAKTVSRRQSQYPMTEAGLAAAIESALLKFAREVLEREPSDHMRVVGALEQRKFMELTNVHAARIYKAMTAELAKELEG